ncbi:MAG: thiamine pyrophosphate-dependent enzyme, partial [Defluviitaleaceae bacterium]|nr:thiamine pyrophosphate-dependent enzyme [Defluviitaleaceae bacterium]
MKQLMTGNEALARGAWEAGVRFASAYPGTPSTEILVNLLNYKEIYAEWAPNEKVSLEAAAGAAVGGSRSVCAMKHVGVNVAADPLFTFAYTGVNAGMVLVTADEPGMHSSQNEQDNRNVAPFAKVPMLEPSNSQECLDMMKEAFELSEKYDVPVLIRITTRIAHSKSIVTLSERVEHPEREYKKDVRKFLPIPAFATGLRVRVEDRMSVLEDFTEKTPLNRIEEGGKIGVIASGVCVNYAKEVFGDDATYLKLGFTHPLPNNLLDEFYRQVDSEKVYVIEENDPYLQHWVERQGYPCIPILPPYGEKTPDVLRAAIFGEPNPVLDVNDADVPPRPPVLCSGCPHRGFFVELAKRKDTIVAGDIGCYTLGFAPPFNAIDYVICMGSAFSAGHGTQIALEQAGKDTRVVGIMGDSTFFHTGINSLMEVVYNRSKTICVILDNRITGMTGQQEH